MSWILLAHENPFIEAAVRVHGALSADQEAWLDPLDFDLEREEHRRLVASCVHRYDGRAVCMLCGEPDRDSGEVCKHGNDEDCPDCVAIRAARSTPSGEVKHES